MQNRVQRSGASLRLGKERNNYLLGGHGLLARLPQLVQRLLVVSQILLAADQDDGQALAEMKDFGNPLQGGRISSRGVGRGIERAAYLLLNVVERVGRVDGKANEDNVGVGVGERAETIVILLTGRIP